MQQVLLFGIGSPITGDFEEAIWRSGLTLEAGVKNRDGEVYLSDKNKVVLPERLDDRLRDLPFQVPLFTPGNRQCAVREARSAGLHRTFRLLDPSVVLPRSLELGEGVFVNTGCSMGAQCFFDDFVFVNRAASVGHHTKLARYVSLGPGAVVAGMVSIGTGTVLGAGAIVLPEISIGANCVIGAGAVVTQDIPDNCLAAGNPAVIQKTAIPGFKGIGVTEGN